MRVWTGIALGACLLTSTVAADRSSEFEKPVRLKAGDAVSIREKARKQLRIQNAIDIAGQVGLPEWVDVDVKKMAGVLKSLPDREDILPDINENLVVELYSK